MDLCTEGFACAARKGHPAIAGKLDLRTYVATPHLVITLGDDVAPTWIDQALAKLGKQRRVALRVRYFMTAPLVIAESDLLLTAPSMLIRYFARPGAAASSGTPHRATDVPGRSVLARTLRRRSCARLATRPGQKDRAQLRLGKDTRKAQFLS